MGSAIKREVLSKYDSPSLSSLGRTDRNPIINPTYPGHLYMFVSFRYIYLYTFLIPRFASFLVSLGLLRPYMPTLILSSLVSMSYATLFHIYGLLSPFSFSYISSIHCCMYSPF